MGYTHYFNFKKNIGEFPDAFLKDVRLVFDRFKDIIQYEEDDASLPVCSKDLIRFNGIKDDAYETFVLLPKHEKFSFCKTARKPYDLPVCIILLLAKYHFGESFQLSSDGRNGSKNSLDTCDENWGPAGKFVRDTFEYKVSAKCFSD